jgi:hypothetical protein
VRVKSGKPAAAIVPRALLEQRRRTREELFTVLITGMVAFQNCLHIRLPLNWILTNRLTIGLLDSYHLLQRISILCLTRNLTIEFLPAHHSPYRPYWQNSAP